MKITPLSAELIETYKTGETEYLHVKKYTEEEIGVLREIITDKSIELEDKNEQLKDIKKEFKDEIEPLKAEIKETLANVRKGSVEEMITVILVPHYESGMMHLYDKKSLELVDYRKLKPDEKQYTIQSQIKAG